MKKIIVNLLVIIALFAMFDHIRAVVISRTDPPLNLNQVMNALEFVKEGKIPIQEITESIKERGVIFPLTAEIVKQLQTVGANDQLIEAIRQHSPPITAENSGEPTAGLVRKNSTGLELVYISPGEFLMGSSDAEIEQAFADCVKQDKLCDRTAFQYESSKHKVTIKEGFWMGKFEVTQGQWQSVMGENPSTLKDCGAKCPVNHVSWENVQAFTVKLNSLNDGFEYRLPSEAEWEYAARAGTTTAFTFGDNINTAQANFDARRLPAPNGKYVGKATEVGKYDSNAFGLHDLHGNLWEWCQDVYTGYKNTPTDGSANTKGSSGRHIARGGAWDRYNIYIRSAQRYPVPPDERDWLTIGFRIVARIKPVETPK